MSAEPIVVPLQYGLAAVLYLREPKPPRKRPVKTTPQPQAPAEPLSAEVQQAIACLTGEQLSAMGLPDDGRPW